jgi:hypothetical protein
MKRKLTTEQKKTRKVIAGMMQENTGRHFLDSGGAYGRHWERNQKRNFENEPSARLDISARHDGEISVYINLYHFLAERLEYAPDVQEQFAQFTERPDQQDNEWADTMNDFVKAIGGTARYAFYTYNEDNMLDQDFIISAWNDADDNAMAFVQIHGGCDARGGFTAPKAFYLRHEIELYDYDRATIYCQNGHWWDYESGYHGGWRNDDNENLENFEIVERDEQEQETDTRVLAGAWREFQALADSIRLPGMSHVKPSMPQNGKIIVDGDTAFCPLCASKLSAEQNTPD